MLVADFLAKLKKIPFEKQVQAYNKIVDDINSGNHKWSEQHVSIIKAELLPKMKLQIGPAGFTQDGKEFGFANFKELSDDGKTSK